MSPAFLARFRRNILINVEDFEGEKPMAFMRVSSRRPTAVPELDISRALLPELPVNVGLRVE